MSFSFLLVVLLSLLPSTICFAEYAADIVIVMEKPGQTLPPSSVSDFKVFQKVDSNIIGLTPKKRTSNNDLVLACHRFKKVVGVARCQLIKAQDN
ncbi:MAG: hypothetical protein EOP06_01335 [Proteobacteria bacterium]|nr:MAG: hypothetical protein EOP06_01335 [Pseudomonadota bacterium]